MQSSLGWGRSVRHHHVLLCTRWSCLHILRCGVFCTSNDEFQVQKFLQVMRVGKGDARDMLLTEEKLNKFACASGDEVDMNKAKKQKTSQDAWQMLHMDYYEQNNIAWPPKLTAEYNGCRGLSQREFEIVFLANKLFPPAMQKDTEVWNLDCNDDIRRNFGPLLPSSPLKNPWRSPIFMTLVGSSQIVYRVIAGYCLRYVNVIR